MFKKPVGMKKALGLLLAASAFTLAACGNGGQETGNTGTTTNNNVETPGEASVPYGIGTAVSNFQVRYRFVSETPMNLSLLFRQLAESPWQNDWMMVQRLQELTGVNLAHDTTAILHDDFAQQRQLLIASGEAPELMPFMYGQYVAQFVAGGQLLPLNDYLEHMPHFNYFLEKWDLQDEFETTRQADGNFYHLPGFQEDIRVRFTVAMRRDILEDLELEAPETWDEVRDVLRAVEDAFPGSIPYQEAWGGDAILNIAARTFGVRFGWGLGNGLILDHATNTHNHISMMPELREFTEYWASLVREGLLLDESLAGGFDAWEQFVNGYSFAVSTNGAPMHASLTRDMQTLAAEGVTGGPFGLDNPSIITLPTPNGPAGFVGENRLNNGLVLNSSIREREDFIAILQFVDWLWYSEEGREFSMWGVEGETFEWVDGRRQLKEGFSNPSFSFGGNAEMADEYQQMQRDLGFGENVWLPAMGSSRELTISPFSEELQQLHLLNATRVQAPFNPGPPYSDEEREIAAGIATAVTDLTNVSVREFIVGNRELNDENWDAFLEAARATGVDRLLELADEAHRRERLGE